MVGKCVLRPGSLQYRVFVSKIAYIRLCHCSDFPKLNANQLSTSLAQMAMITLAIVISASKDIPF